MKSTTTILAALLAVVTQPTAALSRSGGHDRLDERCRAASFSRDPDAVTQRISLQRQLRQPIRSPERAKLRRAWAAIDATNAMWQRQRRIGRLGRSSLPGLEALARAEQRVQAARSGSSNTLSGGETIPFSRRRKPLVAGTPLELNPFLWGVAMVERRREARAVAKLERSKRSARSNWNEADLKMRRWAASNVDLSLERIAELNGLLGAGLEFNGLPSGELRQVPVHGGGRYFVRPEDVKPAMARFIKWYQRAKRRYHPIELAARSYQRLLSIHPFPDGNGRTSRLVMNWVLLRSGYPPATMTRDDKVAIFADGRQRSGNDVLQAVQLVTKGVARTQRLRAGALGPRPKRRFDAILSSPLIAP